MAKYQNDMTSYRNSMALVGFLSHGAVLFFFGLAIIVIFYLYRVPKTTELSFLPPLPEPGEENKPPEPEYAVWYYVKDKKKIGPITRTALEQLLTEGQLLPTAMVLQQGSSQWIALSDVIDTATYGSHNPTGEPS